MQVSGLLAGKGSDVVTVAPDTPVGSVAAQLAQHRIGAVVVSGDGSAIDGIVSERDIVRALADQGASALEQPASAIMTSEVFTCEPRTTVEELMGLMTEHRIRHIPVVIDGKLTAIVSIGDIVKHRIDELQDERDQLVGYIQQ